MLTVPDMMLAMCSGFMLGLPLWLAAVTWQAARDVINESGTLN
jgi:hypothetical protein